MIKGESDGRGTAAAAPKVPSIRRQARLRDLRPCKVSRKSSLQLVHQFRDFLIHGSNNKSENQKEKNNSTLNHPHCRSHSSTHHAPLRSTLLHGFLRDICCPAAHNTDVCACKCSHNFYLIIIKSREGVSTLTRSCSKRSLAASFPSYGAPPR